VLGHWGLLFILRVKGDLRRPMPHPLSLASDGSAQFSWFLRRLRNCQGRKREESLDNEEKKGRGNEYRTGAENMWKEKMI